MAEQHRKKQKKGKNRLLWIMGAVILLLVPLAMWNSKNQQTGEKVATQTVARRTLTELVSASGRIFPETEVSISSDVSGEIIELLIEEGDSVRAGQLLAKIEPDTYLSDVARASAGVNSTKAQLENSKSQVQTAEASRNRAAAELENARQNHTRNEKLFKEGIIAQSEYESSKSMLDQATAGLSSAEASVRATKETVNSFKAQVASAQASLGLSQTSLGRTQILSPITGVVSRLSVEKGERVVGTIQMTGTEMMRIADFSAMEVQVEVSENDIPRVELGNDVDIEVDAYLGRTFKGKVMQIANTASNVGSTSLTSDQVTNFIVTVGMNPASYADLKSTVPFRPGMSASVDVRTRTIADRLTLPIQAVTTRDQEDEKKAKSKDDAIREVVFVIPDGADTVVLREIKTGIQDDEYIHIVSGLKEGEVVVTEPYTAVSRKLEAGDQIQVVEEKELYETEK